MTKRVIICAIVICCSALNGSSALAQTSTYQDSDSAFEWITGGNARPFLEASFGLSQPGQELFTGEFAPLGVVEGKLGYSETAQHKGIVVSLDERYLFGAYGKSEWYPFEEATPEEVTSEFTRFGFGNRLGYGYELGLIGLLLYNQNALNWTKMDFAPPDSLSDADLSILERYQDAYRFGTLAEAGAKFELFGSISAIASVEAAVILPRTVFWPWLGSAMLQYGVQGLITTFSESIIDTSPALGPLIYFALKTAVSYGFYLGMKDRMNWPFDSETPLTTETAKLGAQITF